MAGVCLAVPSEFSGAVKWQGCGKPCGCCLPSRGRGKADTDYGQERQGRRRQIQRQGSKDPDNLSIRTKGRKGGARVSRTMEGKVALSCTVMACKV